MKNEENTIEILDKSLKYGFSQIPRPVLKAKGLSRNAKCLYALLLDYAWQKGSCFPGQERLAKDLNVTRYTIIKDLKELKEFGLITWTQRGLNKTNIYYILSLNFLEVEDLQHPEVNNSLQPDVAEIQHKVEEVEYKKIKNTQSLTLDDNLNLNSFDKKAILIASDLDDLKSIKYYQKIINEEKRGLINSEDILQALEIAVTEKRQSELEKRVKLKKPGALFAKSLNELKKNRTLKEKEERMKNLVAKISLKSFREKTFEELNAERNRQISAIKNLERNIKC